MSTCNKTYYLAQDSPFELQGSFVRTVLLFELHVNCLMGFLDTAIISSSSPPLALSESKFYVPDKESV